MTDAAMFTCELCRLIFRKERSDAEAMAEYVDRFPGFEQEDRSIVCDDCYRKIMGDAR